MKWAVEGMNDIVMSMPIAVKRIHVDNGSEFINAHMYKFCQSMGIEFRRSRPYHKNDAPYKVRRYNND
jgi:transposase InsO family protein